MEEIYEELIVLHSGVLTQNNPSLYLSKLFDRTVKNLIVQ